uniref:asparaginase domain-containing protein n=1 Tax=Vreelandella venusta TaxID=44935 RepID=UPI001551CF4C|nr:asparaginase domain-containing protein [Halomonas hydrothermalis]
MGDLLSDIAVPDGFTLHAEQIAQLDSKDMDFATWHDLYVRSEYWLAQDDVAGLIIVHGTDAREETSYFLLSLIQRSKPIVLSGAMLRVTTSIFNGPQNCVTQLPWRLR